MKTFIEFPEWVIKVRSVRWVQNRQTPQLVFAYRRTVERTNFKKLFVALFLAKEENGKYYEDSFIPMEEFWSPFPDHFQTSPLFENRLDDHETFPFILATENRKNGKKRLHLFLVSLERTKEKIELLKVEEVKDWEPSGT